MLTMSFLPKAGLNDHKIGLSEDKVLEPGGKQARLYRDNDN